MSVVIPVYNRPVQIRRAIDSVLAQTYQNLEILVVDDGSTDTTASVVLAITDPRIRLIRHERNLGGSAARNTGVRVSSGELVAFLDSDDEWLPEKLERQVEVFERSVGDLGLVYSGAVLLFESSSRDLKPRYRGWISRPLLTFNVIGGTSTGMVPRRVLDDVGGFDEALPAKQDADLWLRISQSYTVDFVPASLVRIDKSPNTGRISVNFQNRIRARELFFDKHRDKLIREGLVYAYLRYSGRVYHRLAGDVERARRMYLASLRANPACPRTYLLLLLTYLPEPFYRGLTQSARRLLSAVRRWRVFEPRPEPGTGR